jgi:hypothetical protein
VPSSRNQKIPNSPGPGILQEIEVEAARAKRAGGEDVHLFRAREELRSEPQTSPLPVNLSQATPPSPLHPYHPHHRQHAQEVRHRHPEMPLSPLLMTFLPQRCCQDPPRRGAPPGCHARQVFRPRRPALRQHHLHRPGWKNSPGHWCRRRRYVHRHLSSAATKSSAREGRNSQLTSVRSQV